MPVMRVIGSGAGGVTVTADRVVGTDRWRIESMRRTLAPSQTLIRFRKFDFSLSSLVTSPLRLTVYNSLDKNTQTKPKPKPKQKPKLKPKTTFSISTGNRGSRKSTGGNSARQTDEYTDCKPIDVRSLSQNGDPLGRRDLGKCVVKWISQGMKAMATDFGAAELQGEFAEVRQRMGPGLTFVIQAQPYLSAVPMPCGLESVCLKACTHYPTLFDHFQRELRDVLQGLQGKGLVEDWQKTESWKLFKELAKSAQHRAIARKLTTPKTVHGVLGMELEKVKAIQSRIDDFSERMANLLRVERDSELEFTQQELDAAPTAASSDPNKPIEYLVSHGQAEQELCDTICNLFAVSTYTGLGGMHLVLFKVEGNHRLPPTTLSPGDMVCVRTCDSRGAAGAISGMQGFVNNLGEDGCSITVALESRHGDPTFSKLFGKSVRIDRIQGLADAVTYERNCEALMMLQKKGLHKHNPSIAVVATLFGDKDDIKWLRKRSDLRKDLRQCLKDDSLAAGIRQLLKQTGKQLKKKEKETVKEVLGSAQVVLTTNTGAADPIIRRLNAFDLVVIDEAGQAIEPACWIPILLGRRCILAGDQCQLAPVILSRKALEGGLGISLLEKAISLHDGILATKLTTQYRMNDAISSWASKEMYGGLLKSSEKVSSHLLVDSPFVQPTWITQCPLLLLDTRKPYGSLSPGCEEQLDLAGTGSFYNEGEADIVVQHVLSLIYSGVSPAAIAVQSPYVAQVQLLRDSLDEIPLARGVEIATIDSFQGREADAVIISMVRSNTLGAVGFLGDSRRMNVAITRARKHVAVVCDSSTICHNTFLARLLRHIRYFGRVKHAEPGGFGGSGLGMNPMLPSIS
ncbi:putative hydrolase [Helianthus annuus]|nr:putative hydrolase [Helianthus annuus]KAJ0460460.1 putative hydrolase [Helianthus annuus]KAJ0640899.1 putative hydrolase [Helianthus annuus]